MVFIHERCTRKVLSKYDMYGNAVLKFRVCGVRIGLMVNGVTIAVTLWSEVPTVQARQEKGLTR